MYEGTIKITGETTSDLEEAVAEALSAISGGCVYGFNSNDTGSYQFEIFREGGERDD